MTANSQERKANMLGVLVAPMGALALAGCSINCSPIHSDLPAEKLARRVADRFQKGMPLDEVRAALDRAELRYWDAQIPSRSCLGFGEQEQGLAASVLPRGLIGIGDSLFANHLYFWFGQEEQLERVGYGSWIAIPGVAYRPIRLAAEGAP